MKITQDQRAAVVRKAISERDAILAGAPIPSADVALSRIRGAIAADRCDGETEYARGVNAACENHIKLIDSVIAAIGQLDVATADQTPPPDAHGPEFDNGPDCAKTSGECTCGPDGGNPDLCEHYLRAQARRQSEKGNHTNAERLWDAAKDAEGRGKWFISEKVACRREDGCQTPSKCESDEACSSCCASTPEKPYRRDCWDAGRCLKTVDGAKQ
jgi:hypothetical protein